MGRRGVGGKAGNIALVTLSTTLSSIAQVLFKLGVLSRSLLYLLIAAGIAVYMVSTLIYLYVLSREHLSWTYGVGGLGYILAVVLAVFFLPEGAALLHLTMDSVMRWGGVLVITAGVILISIS